MKVEFKLPVHLSAFAYPINSETLPRALAQALLVILAPGPQRVEHGL